MMLMQTLAESVRSQFDKLNDPEQRPLTVDIIRTTIRGAANTLSHLSPADQVNGRAVLDGIVQELNDKHNVQISYQISSQPQPQPRTTVRTTPSSSVAVDSLNRILVTQVRADIAKLKALPLNDVLRPTAVERVRLALNKLKTNGFDTTELESEFSASFPQDERGRTIEQVNSFFRKFGHTFSSDATQPQAEVPLDSIRGMLRRLELEPVVKEIVTSNAETRSALIRSANSLNATIPSQPVREVVQATRFTSYKIAKSARNEITRLFMLLVNLFLTFKVAVVAAVYVFLTTTPVLAPAAGAPITPVVFDARAQASLMNLASEEASHSIGKVLSVLERGPWGHSDAVVLQYGRTELCKVLSEEAEITREEEMLVNHNGGAFMSELHKVCNNESIWASEAAAAAFYRDAMVGAKCVNFNPYDYELVLQGQCKANELVRAAVTTTNQLKHSDQHILIWVGGTVLAYTLIVSEVLSFGKSKKNKKKTWSTKYKRSIDCNKPKGFSQKQYCTYGRRK